MSKKTRTKKYNPLINKRKRLEKQAMKHPNDLQAIAELQKL